MDRRSFLKGLLATTMVPALPHLPSPETILGPDFFIENNLLVRQAIWSKTMKEMLLDELDFMKFANILED